MMKFSDEDLVRYADGRLDAARTEKLLQAAQSDVELAEALAALDASRLPYKAAFSQKQGPPVPPALKAKVADLVSVSRLNTNSEKPKRQSRWKNAAVAACIALAFAGGYLLSTLLAHQQTKPAITTALESDSSDLPWALRVADYQTLYVPNTVKHIENGGESARTLLASITQSSGMKTAIPDLATHGYRFVRAQELGYQDKTLVQLVYYKEGKAPLALCFMPAQNTQEIETTVLRHEDLGVAYWRHAGQRYVIVADESENTLRELQSTAQTAWL